MKRENNFDFIRLFAAFSVMVIHAVHHLDMQFLWFSKEKGIWFGDGIEVFFIMSGLLVYKSYTRSIETNQPLKNYYKNRFLRIAPAIYAYVVAITFILLMLRAISFNELFSAGFMAWFASNLFLIPVYHPLLYSDIGVGVMNGSLWTIPVEFGFYIVIPFIFLAQQKIGFKKTLGVLMILWSLSFLLLSELNSESLPAKLFGVSFFPYLLFFSLGIFWGRYWTKIPQNKIYAILSLIVYIVVHYNFIDLGDGIFETLVWSIPLSYLVIWFGFKGSSLFNKVTKIGDISFGVYIWHMVVINLFLFLGLPEKTEGWNDTLVLSLVFVVTIAIALMSWHFIEKPALKLKPYNSSKV